MTLRKAIFLIRLLLIVICIQFTAPAVMAVPLASGGHTQGNFVPVKKAGKPLTASSLFEKTETEGEGERLKFDAVEIEDFSISCHFRSQTFKSLCAIGPIILYGHPQPLFRLHCVFLI
jgi:hypothetical protein